MAIEAYQTTWWGKAALWQLGCPMVCLLKPAEKDPHMHLIAATQLLMMHSTESKSRSIVVKHYASLK